MSEIMVAVERLSSAAHKSEPALVPPTTFRSTYENKYSQWKRKMQIYFSNFPNDRWTDYVDIPWVDQALDIIADLKTLERAVSDQAFRSFAGLRRKMVHEDPRQIQIE